MVLEVFLVSSLIEKGQGYSLGNISGGLTKSASLHIWHKKKSRLSQRHDRIFCATMCSLVHVMCTSNNSDPWNERANPWRPPAPFARRLGTTAKVEGRVDSWGAPATCRCDVRRSHASAQWRLDTTRVYPCRAVRPLGVAPQRSRPSFMYPSTCAPYTRRTCWRTNRVAAVSVPGWRRLYRARAGASPPAQATSLTTRLWGARPPPTIHCLSTRKCIRFVSTVFSYDDRVNCHKTRICPGMHRTWPTDIQKQQRSGMGRQTSTHKISYHVKASQFTNLGTIPVIRWQHT